MNNEGTTILPVYQNYKQNNNRRGRDQMRRILRRVDLGSSKMFTFLAPGAS